MKLPDNQIAAIVWAQFKIILNKYPREGAARVFVTYLFYGLWYLMIAAGAVALAVTLPMVKDDDLLLRVIEGGLLLAFLYWQVIPVLLVSTGLSLDLKRLLVYPIPPRWLFAIEVLLRVTTGAEVLILLAGGAVGLWRHPAVPWWGPFALAPFAVFNMFLSAGVRDLLGRLLARKGVREVIVFAIVLAGAAPQFIFSFFPPETWTRTHLKPLLGMIWPWAMTAGLAAGQHTALNLTGLLLWLAAALWFGYWQFQRGLRHDAGEAKARERREVLPAAGAWRERLFRLPSRLLPDPYGNLVEKEIRFLSRATRFRLVFFMGFSFGLVIWLPLLFGRNRSPGFFSENFLVVVTLYAMLLLGEFLFWNSLGYDRHAVQAYYVMPVRLSSVLIGKNLTALFFLFLEITLVVLVCQLLPFRLPAAKVAESYAAALVMASFLLGAGNLASVYYPRAADPSNPWRHSNSGKVQFYMLGLYPLMAGPVALAYLARYAFDRDLAFYAVLGVALVCGLIFYYVALDSAVEAAERRKEQIVDALCHSAQPVG
jgi:ABC-2 type transport system permease protein